MYYVQDRITKKPTYGTSKGVFQKAYAYRILAERDASRANESPTMNCRRVDVVEISKSARLHLENQRRLAQQVHIEEVTHEHSRAT